MQCFTSLQAVVNARLQKNIERAVSRSMQNMQDVFGDRYDPAAHGKVVLFEQSTTDGDAHRLFGHSWANAPLEGVTYDRETNTFLAILLLNNELAHSIVIEDSQNLSPEFRAKLIENLCGEGPL